MDHAVPGEAGRQLLRPPAIALDELDLDALEAAQGAGYGATGAATATGDDDRPDHLGARRGQPLGPSDDRGGAQDQRLVAGAGAVGAGRDDQVVAAEVGHHQAVDRHLHVGQRLLGQRRVAVEPDLAQLHLALGEIFDADGIVAADAVEHPGGRQELCRQQQIDAEDLLVEPPMGDRLLGDAHPHHSARRAQMLGHVGRRQVGLVGRRDRHEQVALADSRRLEHGGVGAVALHRHDVQLVLDPLPLLGIDLDDRDVALLLRERSGEVVSHLARPHHHIAVASHCPYPEILRPQTGTISG